MTIGGNSSITALDWTTAATAKSDISKAAQEFEALLLTRILQGMRSSLGEGLLGSSDGEAGSQMIQLGQEMIAHSLSQNGGVGLAKLVEQGLRASVSDGASAKARD